MRVKATKNVVPMLGARYLRDGRDVNVIRPEDGVVDVPDVRYYRKRIEMGDLALAESDEPPASTDPSDEEA